MRRSVMCVFVIAVLVLLLAGPAAAQRQVTVEPVDPDGIRPLNIGPAGPAQACQVGNLNAPAWAIPGFILPPEEYKLVFDPSATCGNCPMGFDVSTVHVLLQTSSACDIVMAVDVEEVTYSADSLCLMPGPEWCNSGLFTVALPQAGVWNIGLPIDCPCLFTQNMFLLSFQIQSVSCATVPDLITDAGPPSLCTNWNNYGTGWIDLVATFTGWPGDLIFFADAECCSPPVPTEEKTWGQIKSLYRE